MNTATYGDFVIVRDFRGDVEVYRLGDRKMQDPLFETRRWEDAVAFARKHTPKQPPRWVDRLDHPQD